MPKQLRDYQEQSIKEIYLWWNNNSGNPCVVLPTGAGKSLVIAEFCKRALNDYPSQKFIILTHQKELISQDFDTLKEQWPEADYGIFSAGLKRKELNHQLTFAGIQSIYKHAKEIGRVDLILIDEAHLINNEDSGMYRKFINELKEKNPALKCIGFTATPYRLDQGMITDDSAIFSEPLISVITIKELQERGYLSILRSKATEVTLNTEGVKITAGDFNRKELEQAVDNVLTNEQVVEEVIKRASDRKSWVFFCTGVSHAEHIKEILLSKGISAECVTGNTPAAERDQILKDFKDGVYRAITNVGVLTTGFDYKGIDLICLMRPTLSPGLYIQMVGRGLRVIEGKKDCLVLDFAGNIQRHGPIICVKPPVKTKHKRGETITKNSKTCQVCKEIVSRSTKICPCCLTEFPKAPEREVQYRPSKCDINGTDVNKKWKMACDKWNWSTHISKSGNETIKVSLCNKNIVSKPARLNDYFVPTILFGEQEKKLDQIMIRCSKDNFDYSTLKMLTNYPEEFCNEMNQRKNAPNWVLYSYNNEGYPKIEEYLWKEECEVKEYGL